MAISGFAQLDGASERQNSSKNLYLAASLNICLHMIQVSKPNIQSMPCPKEPLYSKRFV